MSPSVVERLGDTNEMLFLFNRFYLLCLAVMVRPSVTLYDDQYKFYKTFKSQKLLVAFIEYMFEDTEPSDLSTTEQVLFDSLRVRMDNQKSRSDA